ncbi:nucleotidyltransferase [Candidatus Saganbacteria bacterium]|nr:nucleotidyltransferase [Candidatus Saganbacteria bacterium]
MPSSLDKLFQKTITLLEKEKTPYLLIGGLAVGVLGEPRMTQDIDLIVFIPKSSVIALLSKMKKAGFDINQTAIQKDLELKGAFRISFEELWVDFIVSSTDFEDSAFQRKMKITLLGKKVNIPSPEDLILLKLIPGRERDILDIKSIIERHRSKLDRKYLDSWAQKLSDEAEDLRIWNTLKKIL